MFGTLNHHPRVAMATITFLKWLVWLEIAMAIFATTLLAIRILAKKPFQKALSDKIAIVLHPRSERARHRIKA